MQPTVGSSRVVELLLLSAKLLRSSEYPKGESSADDFSPLPAAIVCWGVICDGSGKIKKKYYSIQFRYN